MTKKNKKYKVHVCRIGYAHRDIEVQATTIKEAKERALNGAGGLDFSEKDAD